MSANNEYNSILLKQLIAPKIVVVGSINCDLTTYVTAFPKPHETMLGKRAAFTLGGKGLNQAIAAVRAGGSVVMVACVGDDHFGSLAIEHLNKHNVGTEHVHTISQCATGTANILVDDLAQNMIVVAAGANAKLTIEHINAAEQEIAAADMLVVQMEVPFEAVLAALTLAQKYAVPTIFNPAPASIDALELLPLATIFTPNEIEMEFFSNIYPDNHDNISRGVELLQAKGAKIVVITRGSEGCSIAIDESLAHLNAYPVEAIDSTGAGDVFNGVLAVALVAVSKIFNGVIDSRVMGFAVQRASAAAALSVTKASAEGAAPSAFEIESFLVRMAEKSKAELNFV